jgi:hypothetical protein
MDAKITGKSERVGLSIIDNDGEEHLIELDFAGEIKAHDPGGYPDTAAQRDRIQSEHVEQVRRYAQYYVDRETEYDTLPWRLNPDRFEEVREAIASLSREQVETHFGTLFDQSLSHYWHDQELDIDEINRPHELPTEMIGGEDAVSYRQDVYLGATSDIETTSGVGLSYHVAQNDRRLLWFDGRPDLDQDPDARLEVYPAPITELEPFRDYLAYNLRCQIRDCYLMMGLEPPEEYKVLGHGQYRFTGKYHYFEMYPPYHEYDADISGYTHEFAPELPLSGTDIGDIINVESDKSLYAQIKDALFDF